MTPDEPPPFGPALMSAREAAGIPSGTEAARRAGVPVSAVCRTERGANDPRWSTALRLIGRLNLGLEHFVPAGWILAAARRLRDRGIS
jgi:predicted transcriptional regulator